MNAANAEAAARLLIANRAPGATLPETLPDELTPRTMEEMTAIQLATIEALGPIGGWKVGAGSATMEPVAAPLPAAGIFRSPATVTSRARIVEAEICFRFGGALPSRDRAYETADILAAVKSCQAAIEIVDPRFRTHEGLERLVILADLGMHGALVVGDPIAAWKPEMFATLSASLLVNGAERTRVTASNPGGSDLIRLLVWLANSDVVRAVGGLAAGAVVTTGSWTGVEIAPPGGTVAARFDGFAPVGVQFPA